MTRHVDLSFVVVGAQKAGSTAVAETLGRHPEVMVPRRELPLFEGQLFTEANRRAVDEVYRGRGERHLGLRRPDLLLDAEAPARIAAAAGRPVAIAVLRDPVARAISGYWWYMQMGLLPVLPPDAGFARLLERAAGDSDPSWPRAHEVLTFGRYGEGLARYRRALGPDRLVVLLPSDLADGTWRDAVGGRLGLTTPLGELDRDNTGVFSLRRARWLAPRRRLVADATSPDYYARRAQLRRRAGAIAARGLTAVDRHALARVWPEDERSPGPDILRRLRDHYGDDRCLLVDTIQREVDWP